jgi:hypothetical protein
MVNVCTPSNYQYFLCFEWGYLCSHHLGFTFLICTIQGSNDLALAVVDEEDNDTLLLHNITSDDIYRKQEGKLMGSLF